jgi:DNA-binding NarL/FixJ family response regulator
MTRIAIVEDNKALREGLETIVNLTPDCTCQCACETAEEALRKLPALQPEVVLMDIQLPGISGIECTSRLKEKLPSVQIIIVTIYEDHDRIFSALKAGACGYLLKRSTPEQIIAAIHEVLHGGAPMTSEIARKVITQFQNDPVRTSAVESLSPREVEVLELLTHGLANKEIAARLCVSVDAVRWHLKNVYHKLHVHSRTEAALKFRPRMN